MRRAAVLALVGLRSDRDERRRVPRVLVFAAVGAIIGALAAIPAVTAANGGGGDTVGICHALGSGKYEFAHAPETDFYGSLSGHGTDTGDIVPPFTIDDPGPDDPRGFRGRNWDDRGQQILNHGCTSEPPAPIPPGPSKTVRICHATSSRSNPYISNEPAIENNGDLKGGHLNHEGPVFPADDWGDIIPPYSYVDEDGSLQQFEGYNWSEEGQAIYGSGCDLPAPEQPEPLTPTLQCVESAGDGFLAHFGYTNPNATTIQPAENFFDPPPGDRGQPDSFEVGSHADAVQVPFDGSALIWNLTGNKATASSESRSCGGGSLTVTKQLLPADDPGRFALKIDGVVEGGASEAGNGGTTGSIAVSAGRHTVSESGASGTELVDYQTWIVCRSADGGVVAQGSGPSLEVTVTKGAAIVCTITNQAKDLAEDVSPLLQCVVFAGDRPSLAYWGYENGTGSPIVIPLAKNHFAPTPANRGQPIQFQAGSYAGVFKTAFDAGESALTWTLPGGSLTADASSPRCTATVEVQKLVEPSSDAGVFNLRIDGETLESGGNGTTTGPITVGAGEATVSETAGPGTNLADYDSSVVCARNGTVGASVEGTKLDVPVQNGDVVVCRFTNVRRGTPTPPTPDPPIPTPTPPTPIPPPDEGPKPLLDLDVVKTGRPAAVSVGGRITWTMTVTNRSSVEAADVNGLKVNDPRPFRTELISLRTSQGTCRPYVCDLGRLAPGASATVIAVTRALSVGPVVDIVRVSSEEIESNYRNNVASALVRVVGAFRPPKPARVCRTLTAAPRVLQAERASLVLLTARDPLGRPLVGFPIRVRGAGLATRVRTGRQGIARVSASPSRAGLILFAGGRHRVVKRSTCITVLAAVRARQIHVTG